MAELAEDAPLTADEILTFGPCVEAQVWTPIWLMQERAPIARAAGKPKFGPVFNSSGIGKAVVIRPCISRGKRIRGLPPIYTPAMLQANAAVFTGWPMFMDHIPPQLAETLMKRGRSVKELGGQVVQSFWGPEFLHEDDPLYGYEKGGVLAEVWATDFMQKLVGNNPNLLHTSINAWPTAGKPGTHRGIKGMVIEGIRRQPQGSLDYVVRGGAGGRLLAQEGEENVAGEWPQIAEADAWPEEARSFVVSLADSYYSAAPVEPNTIPDLSTLTPDQLREHVRQHAPQLLPALREEATPPTPGAPTPSITEADVARMIESAQASQPKVPSVDELKESLREEAEQLVEQREAQRTLSAEAHRLIESAEGIPASWKADLKARYSMLPSGPSQALLVEEETDDDGKTLSEMDVLTRNVKADLDHARDLIAEATGKPRVKGEGGKTSEPGGETKRPVREAKSETPYWAERFAEMGIVEGDNPYAIHGVEKVEG